MACRVLFSTTVFLLWVACGSDTGQTVAALRVPKSVSTWLAQVRSGDVMTQRRARRSPKEIGSNRTAAATILARALADKDPRVRRYVADAMGEYQLEPARSVEALIQALADPDRSVRDHAAIALTKIGAPAIPRLLAVIRADPNGQANQNRPTMRAFAAFALGKIKAGSARIILKTPLNLEDLNPYEAWVVSAQPQATADALRAWLTSPAEKVQLLALDGLSEDRQAALNAAPELVRLLRQGRALVQERAVDVLREIGPEASAAVPALIEELKSPNAKLRIAAAEALGRIGDPTELSVPALTGLLQGADKATEKAALQALAYIGPSAVAACPTVRSLASPADIDESTGLDAIRSVCPHDRATIEALVALAADPNQMPRVVSTLGFFGPDAVPDLVALYRKGDPKLRQNVVEALGNEPEPLPSIISALTDALADPDRKITHDAAVALGRFGTRQNATPELTQQLPTIVSALTHALADPDLEYARDAAVTLARLGAAARSATPELIRQYNAKRNRAALNCAFAGIGPDAAEALPVLRDVAADKVAYEQVEDAVLRGNGYDACSMSSTFAHIGHASVPFLVELLASPHFAGNALANLLGEDVPKDTAPSVVALLGDSANRDNAAQLLSEMGDAGFAELAKATLNPDANERESAVIGLRKANRGCDSTVSIAKPLAHDPEPRVRIQAGWVFKDCPAAAPEFAALKDDPDESVRSAFREEPPKPSLLERFLSNDAGDRESIANQIEALGDEAKPFIPRLRDALSSSNEELAEDAALLLSRLDAGPDDDMYRSLLLDSFLESYMRKTMRLIEVYTGEIRLKTGAAGPGDESLPKLPWPIPKPSRLDVIPKTLLSEAKTLGEVYSKLNTGLGRVGFGENGIFAVPAGFAIVTGVERIADDMASYKEPERWTSGKLPLRAFSLTDYLSSLFLDRPGQFRLFMFMVTDKSPELSNKQLTEKEARDLALEGDRILPNSIADEIFADKQCYVLVYHFERKVGGDAAELTPSPFMINTHLTGAGLTQFVQ